MYRIAFLFFVALSFSFSCRFSREPSLNQKILLGEQLFYSPILGDDEDISCASCHKAEWAFGDNVPTSQGAKGYSTIRNSPGLFNLTRRAPYLSEGGVNTLEEVIIAPLHDTLEMASNIGRVVRRMWQDTTWLRRWFENWDSLPSPATITRSLASYLRTLKSESSRADRYYRGNNQALNVAEIRGALVFASEKSGCTKCHFGPDLTDNLFHNVGVNVSGKDQGRYRLTFKNEDKGKFKTPTLRNLRFTAPYMHDGSLTTLESVLDHYMHEGHPFSENDEIQKPIYLTKSQKSDLISFLMAMSDSDFVEHYVRREKELLTWSSIKNRN